MDIKFRFPQVRFPWNKWNLTRRERIWIGSLDQIFGYFSMSLFRMEVVCVTCEFLWIFVRRFNEGTVRKK